MSNENHLVQRIDELIEQKSLLKHPFYQMWSQGQLTAEHLRGYAKEYFQLVKEVPKMVESIATNSLLHSNKTQKAIKENAAEEAEHVLPWVQFANSLGISTDELDSFEGAAKTKSALSTLKTLSQSSFEESVAAMYSYESELPKISRSKIDGLRKFYDFQTKNSLRYFEIHEEADIRHAEVWREILQACPEEKQQPSLAAASRSLDAQNLLLDSVLEMYVTKNHSC